MRCRCELRIRGNAPKFNPDFQLGLATPEGTPGLTERLPQRGRRNLLTPRDRRRSSPIASFRVRAWRAAFRERVLNAGVRMGNGQSHSRFKSCNPTTGSSVGRASDQGSESRGFNSRPTRLKSVLPRSARNTRKEPEGRGWRAGCRIPRTASFVAREGSNGSTSGTMRRADAAVCETPGSVELLRETIAERRTLGPRISSEMRG